MSDATRQHYGLATGKGLNGKAEGPSTRKEYAVGGHVHKGHGHSEGVSGHGTLGHSPMKHKRSGK